MSNYQKSKIYKLVSPHTDEIYIGSTVQRLCHRLSGHKRDCREGKVNTNKKLFELGEVKIILIEDFPCDRKEELIKRERYYIENFDCVNKCIPGRTHKEYYQVNKEKILKQKKEYYHENQEKILEKKKEKLNCECGTTSTIDHKARHEKTKKHQKYLLQNN